ncbi:MobF family relaxase [Streptomyces cyaneofuscatus]
MSSSPRWSSSCSSSATFTTASPKARPSRTAGVIPCPPGPGHRQPPEHRRPGGSGLTLKAEPSGHHVHRRLQDTALHSFPLGQDIAVDKTLAWVGESVAQIRWGSGGKRREPIRDGGLIVAVFRHYESRAAESRPLLHDHAVVSIRARRPDEKGTWGNLSADSLLANIVAADTLYVLTFMEEVSGRLGWAWEPREVTPGRRPVVEIAGIDQRLIGWQSTRRQQIEDALSVLTAEYEEKHGHAPGERTGYALGCQAADRTRPPKRTELRSLSELREGWRESAIRRFGADAIDQLAVRARAAAAEVWARVRPVVDVILAAVNVVAVVYVMRGAFKRHHLLAEARRHLAYVLRGRPHQPGLDEQIVEAAIDGYTRPASRHTMTADLSALYPRDTDDQAVLRPLTRKRSAPPYERACLAAGALTARVHATRRSERLNSRTRPHPVPVPDASRSRPRASRTGRKAGLGREQGTDVAALEQTRATIEAATTMAAKLQDGVRERAAARAAAPRPASEASSPPHTHQPGVQQTQGRTPLEESHDHTGREPGAPGTRGRPHPRPRSPRRDGRRARRGPGARVR